MSAVCTLGTTIPFCSMVLLLYSLCIRDGEDNRFSVGMIPEGYNNIEDKPRVVIVIINN